MQLDLSGVALQPVPVPVEVYVDEAKSDPACPWAYVGYLLLPLPKKAAALERLRKPRAEVGYHREVHFHECQGLQSPKTAIASAWLHDFLSDPSKTFHFHLCGLNTERLAAAAFGPAPQADAIYNRFFRSGLQFAIKRCFGLPARVSRVVHDRSHLADHPYFDWHAIHRIRSQTPDIEFETRTVEFLDSDHTAPAHPDPAGAEMIQLADVVLGAMRQCHQLTSEDKGKRELARVVHPLMQRITVPASANNPNSRYHHYRRVSVGFFPRGRLSARELADDEGLRASCFYLDEPLRFEHRFQLVLDP